MTHRTTGDPAGPAAPGSPARGVSSRAIAVGLVGCLTISLGEPFGVLVVQGSPLAADFSTGISLFLLFLLTLVVNPAARVLTGWRLHRGELITVYIMMIVSAAIPSWGFMMNLVPLMGGFFYFSTPENEWAALILPHLPDSMMPADQDAVWKLFEGVARGEPVPWDIWLKPLLFWFLFILNIYFVTLCLLVILRRQWVERERLLFPLAILPLEMTAPEEDGSLPRFFRNPLTWAGFSLPAVVNSINALHAYYNFIPGIDLNARLLFLRNAFSFILTPRFEVIGLSYLLSLDVSFGVWFFAFLFHFQTAVERVLGWTVGPTQPFSDPAPPTVAHIGMGSLLVLVLSGFYFGRHHLRDVFRKALRGDPEVDDSDEIMSYRVAGVGLVAGTVLAVVWLAGSGLGILGAGVFFLTALVVFLGLARIISQTGLAYARATVTAPVFTVNALGAGLLGPAGITTLGLHFAWSADVRTFVMASAATGMKLAEVTRLETRRLLWAILLAILVTLAGSAWAVIELGYKFGGINLGFWHFVGLPQFAGNWITQTINNPGPTQTWHLGYMGIGAVLMTALAWVKARFVGFPLHPVGLALGLTVPIYRVWFSVFIAWLAKAVVLKYGGANLYLRLRPFFLGMTLGAFTSAGLWLVVDGLTGMTGNRFTVG